MIGSALYVLAAMCLPVLAHPHNDGRHQPRQTDPFEDPAVSTSTPVTDSPTESGFFDIPASTTSSTLPTLDALCESRVSAFASAVPTPRAEVLDFSESYYLTATRTATGTQPECAWITATPDKVDDALVDWLVDFVEWSLKPETQDAAQEIVNCVPDGYETDDTACMSELKSLQSDLSNRIADRITQRSGAPAPANMATWGIAMASFVSVLLIL